jgi:hypothetical protein
MRLKLTILSCLAVTSVYAFGEKNVFSDGNQIYLYGSPTASAPAVTSQSDNNAKPYYKIAHERNEHDFENCVVTSNSQIKNIHIVTRGNENEENPTLHFRLTDKNDVIVAEDFLNGQKLNPDGIPTEGELQERSFVREPMEPNPVSFNLTYRTSGPGMKIGDREVGTIKFKGMDVHDNLMDIDLPVSCE